ncbi:hypothetical protein ACS0TY_027256 [Phlomoides rotata]
MIAIEESNLRVLAYSENAREMLGLTPQSVPNLERVDILTIGTDVRTFVRELTGYDRVMVYKFHEDEHGGVVAESKRPDLDPYPGLHYPSTDIPQASRAPHGCLARLLQIDVKLRIKSREDVIKMGIKNYNEECRGIVQRYVAQLFQKGLVYRGFKVMPYSIGCKTPLSNFEANSNYREVPDPEIMVAFPVVDDSDGASLVAWTTTPWTLPSNLALCVNAKFVYVKVRNKFNGKVLVIVESRLAEFPVEKAKKGLVDGAVGGSENSESKPKSSGGKTKSVDTYEILGKYSGASLVGMKYVPLFDYCKDYSDVAFKVVADNYVTNDSGTGVVHCAPAFGKDVITSTVVRDVAVVFGLAAVAAYFNN